MLTDTTTAGERTLTLRLTPQRQVRLTTLHVDTNTATVRDARVAGRTVPVEEREPRSQAVRVACA